MTNGARVEVKGDKRLARTLHDAGQELEEMPRALPVVSRQVVTVAMSKVPRDTGRLAASLDPTVESSAAVILSTLPYAGVIHWGWPARNIAPQPFLVEAGRQAEPAWTKTFEAEAERILGHVRGA